MKRNLNKILILLHSVLPGGRISAQARTRRMLMRECIAKRSQSLSLTSHNLQNIFVSLMKVSIYISQSLLLGESLAFGKFTFKVLMTLHFFLFNTSVGSSVASWSNYFLTEGAIGGIHQYMASPVLCASIWGLPNPQVLPHPYISTSCFSLLIHLWIWHCNARPNSLLILFILQFFS